jgi:hypothetical protein
MRRRTQRRDGILISAYILHDDVVHLVLLQLRCQIDVDLDPVLRVLLLDRM